MNENIYDVYASIVPMESGDYFVLKSRTFNELGTRTQYAVSLRMHASQKKGGAGEIGVKQFHIWSSHSC